MIDGRKWSAFFGVAAIGCVAAIGVAAIALCCKSRTASLFTPFHSVFLLSTTPAISFLRHLPPAPSLRYHTSSPSFLRWLAAFREASWRKFRRPWSHHFFRRLHNSVGKLISSFIFLFSLFPPGFYPPPSFFFVFEAFLAGILPTLLPGFYHAGICPTPPVRISISTLAGISSTRQVCFLILKFDKHSYW